MRFPFISQSLKRWGGRTAGRLPVTRRTGGGERLQHSSSSTSGTGAGVASDAGGPNLALTADVPLADAPPRLRPISQPISAATDARWVLAVRVAEQLEGAILALHKRDRLVRLGKIMGLTAFDANLIIAIVQDQARRGVVAGDCPTAGRRQLAMIAPPGSKAADRAGRVWAITCAVVTLVVIEILIVILLV